MQVHACLNLDAEEIQGSPLILYMHLLDDVTHIKLVDIVDFTHIYQAYIYLLKCV